MEEGSKDAVEFVVGQVAAGVLELLPGGSLMSRALLLPIELAERKRTAVLLDKLLADVAALSERGWLPPLDELCESELFLASITESVRAMKGTADEGKRKLLRNAVLNTQLDDVPAERSEFFLRVISRYGTLHVEMLTFIEKLPAYVSPEVSYPRVAGKPSGVMRDLPGMLKERFPADPDLVYPAFNELRNDRMIELSQPQTYALQNTGDATRPDTISNLGRSFLQFLREPDTEDHGREQKADAGVSRDSRPEA